MPSTATRKAPPAVREASVAPTPLESLIAQEVSALTARSRYVSLPGDFVARCIDAHSADISRWNGLRYHFTAAGDFTNAASDANGGSYNIIYNFYRDWVAKNGGQPLPYNFIPNFSPALYAEKVFTDRLCEYWGGVSYTSAYNIANFRAGQSVSRAVLADLKRRIKSYAETYYDYESTQQEFITGEGTRILAFYAALFSELGNHRKTSRGCHITVSVAPSDFAWLGDMEVEAGSDSCFQSGGAHEASKYNLALTPEAFVMYFYFTNEPQTVTDPNALIRDSYPDARLWGYRHKNGRSLVMSNLYRSEWRFIEEAAGAAAVAAFGLEEGASISPNTYSSTINFDSEFAYCNGDARIVATAMARAAASRELYDQAWQHSMNFRSVALRCCSHADCDRTLRGDRINCYECDETFCSNHASYCNGCDEYYCDRCRNVNTCSDCDATRCTRCREFTTCNAPGCHSLICENCGTSCEGCGEVFCVLCANAEGREPPPIIANEDGDVYCPDCCDNFDELVLASAEVDAYVLDRERTSRLERIAVARARQQDAEVRQALFEQLQRYIDENHPIYEARPFELQRAIVRGCDCDHCERQVRLVVEYLSQPTEGFTFNELTVNGITFEGPSSASLARELSNV